MLREVHSVGYQHFTKLNNPTTTGVGARFLLHNIIYTRPCKSAGRAFWGHNARSHVKAPERLYSELQG